MAFDIDSLKVYSYNMFRKQIYSCLIGQKSINEQERLGSIPRLDKVLLGILSGISYSRSLVIWICARLMAIAPYFMGLKDITDKMWLYY